MRGVEAKLDYIQEMGVTAIWMTPLLRNKAIQSDGFGHHGYWVIDFTEIDPHFGTNEDLRSLIDAAHERGIQDASINQRLTLHLAIPIHLSF
jgi:glycosidase